MPSPADISRVELARRTSTAAAVGRPHPLVVRCACAVCGAHTNAVKAFRITGSCPNCGSFELTPVVGAAPVDGPVAA